jgi:hypothetical protein
MQIHDRTKPRRVGRPTKFTAARQRVILEALRAANYIETAVLAAGVGKTTF